MAIALVALAVILLWVAAAVFGRDSRNGSDWFNSRDARERAGRLGD